MSLILAGCSQGVDPGSLNQQETQAPPEVKAMPDAKNPGHVFGRDNPAGGGPRAPKGGK